VEDREQVGSAWTPPVRVDRSDDGRPVYVVGGRRYVEVPLGAEDAYRFLGELRLEMTPAAFRAFVIEHRAELSPVVLWRLGMGPAPTVPQTPAPAERARRELSNLLRAA